MTKIVYNACYGGFGLSEKATLRIAELKGIKLYKGTGNSLYTPFYLVPEEEYERLKAEADNKRDWTRLNEVYYSDRDIERDDPILVQVVEELGEEASGMCADLQIAELPAGSFYRIDEYDGNESVMTSSDYEWKVAK